jgi:hypothetical protein
LYFAHLAVTLDKIGCGSEKHKIRANRMQLEVGLQLLRCSRIYLNKFAFSLTLHYFTLSREDRLRLGKKNKSCGFILFSARLALSLQAKRNDNL